MRARLLEIVILMVQTIELFGMGTTMHTLDIFLTYLILNVYKNGVMNINVASNNFGDHYINGILVFGDYRQGNGHGAEYWNDEVQIYHRLSFRG